jgi:hypothetical protein
METFIYSELKKASLNKDESRIPTLGPYAATLSYVIRNANVSRIKKEIFVDGIY